MNTAAIINLVSSIMLAAAMYKQAKILAIMKSNDPQRITKILFPLFNVFILCGMWLQFAHNNIASAIFFLMAAGIVFWTYYEPIKK